MRCARCGTQWAPVPIPPPVIEPVPELQPAPMPISVEPPSPMAPPLAAKQPVPLALLLAWVGSVVVILALLAAAIVWRETVMQHWPPSIRLYSLLGLTARP